MSNPIRKAAKTAAKASRAPAELGTARSDDAGNSDDDDDENGDGAAQSGKGSRRGRSAPRSSADGDRLGSANGRVERDRGVFVKFGRDHLRTILDSATLAGEPVHLRLDVTAFPAEEDGWARVVAEDVIQTSKRPSGTPPKRRPSTPIAKRGLRRRRRMRTRTRDEDDKPG
jgi:hypothetical protein